MTEKEIYYGAGYEVRGPYHPDEIAARAAAQAYFRGKGAQAYEIKASSYEDARRKLLGVVS